MTYTNLTLEISDSGKIAVLRYPPMDRIIAELLIHGNLIAATNNAVLNNPIKAGYANVFRGEVFQLASYEILDKQDELIREKENKTI